MSATKHDADKPRMDLIPPEAMHALSSVLTYGAEKYSARNWEAGMAYSRMFAAAQRHLWAFWGGENVDGESNLPHLWHAFACLAFLITYDIREIGSDDRR